MVIHGGANSIVSYTVASQHLADALGYRIEFVQYCYDKHERQGRNPLSTALSNTIANDAENLVICQARRGTVCLKLKTTYERKGTDTRNL